MARGGIKPQRLVLLHEIDDTAGDLVHLAAKAADQRVVLGIVLQRVLDIVVETHVLGDQVCLELRLEARQQPRHLVLPIALCVLADAPEQRHQIAMVLLQ